MHRSLRLLASLLPIAFASTGCGVLLGIDDFTDAPATGGGSAGGTSTTGGGGTGGGGTGGATTGGGGTGGTGGMMTGGGGTGGTTGTVCTPDEKVTCYEGPDGTDGVGACKSGLKQCNAAGTDFGPCEGQVLPDLEICSKPSDDDCDGLGNLDDGCCVPDQSTTCYTGPPGTAGQGQCKAGVVLCNSDGTFPAQCPNQVLPADEFCAAPADEDCNGKNCWVWTQAKGGFGLEYGSVITTQPFQQKVAFAGAFKGSLDLGGGILNSVGNTSSDAFLAVYNPDGTHVWSKRFGGEGSEAIYGVGWDMNGGIAIAGRYLFGDLDLGGGALGEAQNFDGFVARLMTDGTHYWSTAIGGADSQQVVSLKWVTDGLLIAGDYNSMTLAVGGGAVTSSGGYDMFVAKLGKMNTDLVWLQNIGGTGAEAITGSQTMDGDFVSGAAYVVGSTSTAGLDLGKGPLPTGSNLFLAKYAAGGQTEWTQGFNVVGYGFSVASTMSGPYLAGTMQGTTYLGSPAGTTLSADGKDIAVASYSAAGGYLWQKSFGGPGDQAVSVVAADSTGVWIAGVYDTAFQLGAFTLPAPGIPGAGSFVAKLDTTGAVVWAHAMGGAPAGLAIDDDDFALITGDFNGTADFGGGSLAAVGSSDVFVTRLGR